MSTNCPKCHMENPAESKSCVHCGLLLDAVDKIPTFHPETEETKTVEAPAENLESIQSASEPPGSKSLFSGFKGLFRKNKTK